MPAWGGKPGNPRQPVPMPSGPRRTASELRPSPAECRHGDGGSARYRHRHDRSRHPCTGSIGAPLRGRGAAGRGADEGRVKDTHPVSVVRTRARRDHWGRAPPALLRPGVPAARLREPERTRARGAASRRGGADGAGTGRSGRSVVPGALCRRGCRDCIGGSRAAGGARTAGHRTAGGSAVGRANQIETLIETLNVSLSLRFRGWTSTAQMSHFGSRGAPRSSSKRYVEVPGAGMSPGPVVEPPSRTTAVVRPAGAALGTPL